MKTFWSISPILDEFYVFFETTTRPYGTFNSFFEEKKTKINQSSLNLPSYPISNIIVEEDGSVTLEVAVSGFSKEEIEVERDDLKIIVRGTKNEKEESKKNYIHKGIAERNFEFAVPGSDKWDFSKLKVALERGILTIKIPLKEECKPVKQKFEIQ